MGDEEVLMHVTLLVEIVCIQGFQWEAEKVDKNVASPDGFGCNLTT
jgi:hypothetical protein